MDERRKEFHSRLPRSQIGRRGILVESMNKIKTDMQCPFCGECATRYVFPTQSRLKCYVCDMVLFLKYIDDDPETIDERGFGRLAYEPFIHNEEIMELNEVFR